MKSINPYDLNESVFRLLDKDWMLITAGKKGDFNTMTASWGGFGILWHQPVAFIFVRPTRYTHQFFFLCFFERKYRKALNYCGNHSGRDVDKIRATGLVPGNTIKGNIFFTQARLILECRKLYYDDIEPEHFIEENIQNNYPLKDYHRLYVGRVENCWYNE